MANCSGVGVKRGGAGGGVCAGEAGTACAGSRDAKENAQRDKAIAGSARCRNSRNRAIGNLSGPSPKEEARTAPRISIYRKLSKHEVGIRADFPKHVRAQRLLTIDRTGNASRLAAFRR